MCELWIVKLVNKLDTATRLILLILVLNGCTRKYHMAASPVTVEKKIPDYSMSSYWAALPGRPDPSDSIPLQKCPDKPWDAFHRHSYPGRPGSFCFSDEGKRGWKNGLYAIIRVVD